jgi:hypothetical protein
VYVSVEKNNDAALRLYERLGYVKAKLTEVRPDSYHRKRMHAKFIWLEKKLTNESKSPSPETLSNACYKTIQVLKLNLSN